MGRFSGLVAVLVVVAGTVAAACGGGDGGTPNATVAVTEKDFSIAAAPASVTAGKTKFDIKNNGPSEHYFYVFKSDLDSDKLPMKGDKVDEEGQGVTEIADVDDIGSGSSKNTTKDLAAGKYVLICNLPGHYQKGMRAGFTVQ